MFLKIIPPQYGSRFISLIEHPFSTADFFQIGLVRYW